jgi:hypothetical protein
MSSELLAAGRTSPSDPGPSPGTARAPTVGEAFDPYLAGGRPSGDPGARHAAWTLAVMLRGRVRDLMAAASDPLDAAIVGAAEGWLGLQLLAWGVGTVTLVDARTDRLERALELAELTAADPARTHLRAVPDLSHARIERFDLALLDGREGMPGGRGPAIPAAAARADRLILLTDRRHEAHRALLEAGLADVELIHPPADAERRLVKLEWALISARPAADS